MSNVKELREQIHHLKVLFIDDEEEIRKSTSSFLEKFFGDLYICKDGKEGLEVFKESFEDPSKKDFDVIITDIKMPKIDGAQMIDEIKKLKNDIYTVFITACREDETHTKQSDVYIKKPLSYDDIIFIMEEIKKHFS